MLATVTNKGQVTLPKKLRDQLHLKPGDRIEFLVDERGNVTLLAITAPITKLKGLAPKSGRPLSLDEMDEAIAEGAAEK